LKILLIQLKQIGDVLMTTPALRALRKKHPGAEIHFLTQKPSNQIFEFNPFVDRVIDFPTKSDFRERLGFIESLRKEKYDVAIDFLGLPKTALLTKLIGAKKRIGFKKFGRSLFYTERVFASDENLYSVEHKIQLLRSLGVHSTDFQLDFFYGNQDLSKAQAILQDLHPKKIGPLISISPVSRQAYKVWPAENFAVTADYLIDKYQADILFLWGPNEYGFIKAVKDKMKNQPLGDYDIPTIRETAALLKLVDLHIGNDNGPMHFAIAVKTPSVAVFGRPKLSNWTPPESKTHLAIEYDPGCKSNCVYPRCELQCLTGVEISKVIELADLSLNQQFMISSELKLKSANI